MLTSQLMETATNAYRTRLLRRVVAELSDGQPVVLEDTQSFLVIAAETATPLGLTELESFAACNATLLLAAGRASLLGYQWDGAPEQPRAFKMPWQAISPTVLQSLADPTIPTALPHGLETVPAPRMSELILTLVKRAKLLPAALVAQLAVEGDLPTGHGNYLTVAPTRELRLQLGERPRLRRIAEANLPIKAHDGARMVIFRNDDDDAENVVIIIGDPSRQAAPLVRLHSACFTGETFGSVRCDCGGQLQNALDRIAAEGAGILIYLSQEGRGIGLSNKLRAYHLQDLGYDTLQANHALGWENDARSFEDAAAILKELHISRIRLLSSNTTKLADLTKRGIEVQLMT